MVVQAAMFVVIFITTTTLLQRALNHSWNEIFKVKVEVNVATPPPFCGVLSWNLGSWLLDKRQMC